MPREPRHSETPATSPPTTPPRPGTPDDAPLPLVFSISRRSLGLLGLVALAPWLLAVGAWLLPKLSRPAPVQASGAVAEMDESPTSRTFRGRPGPWGELEYRRIAIEPPDEFISAEAGREPVTWYFEGYTHERLLALLGNCPLTPAQRGALTSPEAIRGDDHGLVLQPDPELVLALTPKAREMIYLALAVSPRNAAQQNAFVFRPEFLEERLEGSGLTADSVVLLKSLLYRHGNLRLFADLQLALPRLPDHQERLRFIKTVARRNTLLANLRVTEDTDLERLVNYWGGQWRAKDIRPLLESVRRIPGGGTLDVAHLLPSFARRRLYTYPTPDIAARGAAGPHWTSLNFFSEQPDDRFNDDQIVTETIQKHYYVIAGGYRLGDLVVLMAPDGSAVHTAVYVADGVAFTRNGSRATNPWQLMRVRDLVEFFAARTSPEQPLRVEYMRQREQGVLSAP
jgi:hypothetical protein